MPRSQAEALPDGSGAMFDGIARHYDLLNRLMSLGMDQGWRIQTVTALDLPPDAKVLDVATGTADLAVMLARSQPSLRVVGLDPSKGMLAVGRKKARSSGVEGRLELCEGDVLALPFEDGSFDAVSMAFGIRNVKDRARAFEEMRRVTKAGGKIAILELSEPPRRGVLAPVMRWFVHRVVPWMGALLSGAEEYRYLQRSIEAFPPPPELARALTASCLEVIETRRLTFGVCHLYLARRPA